MQSCQTFGLTGEQHGSLACDAVGPVGLDYRNARRAAAGSSAETRDDSGRELGSCGRRALGMCALVAGGSSLARHASAVHRQKSRTSLLLQVSCRPVQQKQEHPYQPAAHAAPPPCLRRGPAALQSSSGSQSSRWHSAAAAAGSGCTGLRCRQALPFAASTSPLLQLPAYAAATAAPAQGATRPH